MKTKIRKFVLPMVVALIAIAGAFASNQSRQDKAALADRIGHVKVGLDCIPTSIICTTIENPQMCTSGATVLFNLEGTACPLPLYRKL